MKSTWKIAPAAALALLGCLSSNSDDKQDGIHARNDQYALVLTATEDTAFFSTGFPCNTQDAYSIGYRQEGKRLVVDFGISSANVKIGNIYDLVEDKGFPMGVWKYAGNKVIEVLDSTEETPGEIDSLLEMDEFIYGEEVIYIGPDRIDFSYPHAFLYKVAELRYHGRKGGGASVEYAGKDSIDINDDGHRISIKYQPYRFFSARSSRLSPAISKALDSCNAWDEAMADTWLYSFLNPSIGTEKTSVASRSQFHSIHSIQRKNP